MPLCAYGRFLGRPVTFTCGPVGFGIRCDPDPVAVLSGSVTVSLPDSYLSGLLFRLILGCSELDVRIPVQEISLPLGSNGEVHRPLCCIPKCWIVIRELSE